MFCKMMESTTILLVIFGIAGVGGYTNGSADLIQAIAPFMIALPAYFIAKHEGGFRSYEKDVDNGDVDALIRKQRKSGRNKRARA